MESIAVKIHKIAPFPTVEKEKKAFNVLCIRHWFAVSSFVQHIENDYCYLANCWKIARHLLTSSIKSNKIIIIYVGNWLLLLIT